MSVSTVPVIKFRFKRAAKIVLADGMEYQPETQMREQPNPYQKVTSTNGGAPRVENRIVAPFYLLDKVFEVYLHDEAVLVPKDAEGMPERFRAHLEDEAFKKAIEAREANKVIRQKLDHYAETGTIEIIEDSLKVEMVKYQDAKVETPVVDEEPVTPVAPKTEKSKPGSHKAQDAN